MFNGTHYNMWYSTFSTQLAIGFAWSRDGVNWTKYNSPVLAAGPSGSWDEGGVQAPSVIWNGTLYLMYYTGANRTFASDIGLASSKDMVHWQKYEGNPILTRTANKWDAYSVEFASAIHDSALYKMWYTGRQSLQVPFGSIGYAFSSDGLHWTKYDGNPVITPNNSEHVETR